MYIYIYVIYTINIYYSYDIICIQSILYIQIQLIFLNVCMSRRSWASGAQASKQINGRCVMPRSRTLKKIMKGNV